MPREEKVFVIAMTIFDNPINPKDLCEIFNIHDARQSLKGERQKEPPLPTINLWGISTSGGDDFVEEWQKLKDLFQDNWKRIPQVLIQGGYVQITVLPIDEDLFYPISLSQDMIEDLRFINATFQVGV